MIKGISQNGRYLQVSNGSASTYVNGYAGAQGVGNLRYNTSNQSMEVFDGNTWMVLNMTYATVGLTGEAESLLDWARAERDRQYHREIRIKNNPALKKAYEAIQRAEANFDMLDRIVGSDADHEQAQVQASP